MKQTPSSSVTVDIVIFTIKETLKVLMIKRKYPPYQGLWAIPGGFVREQEGLQEAARRELEEETGVKDVYLEQLYTFGAPSRDPRGRVITVAYIALVDSTRIRLKPTTDAKEAYWFSVCELPELAFDHKQIIHYAVERLRNKLEYTTVGFQLLPKKFTLAELQKTYEIILNKSLDKRNFRKKILALGLLHPLKETRMEGVHRPAQLYSFRAKAIILRKGAV